MVFTPREIVYGLKHLRLKWGRTLQKRPDTWFIKDYEGCGYLVERLQQLGEPSTCRICGYAMIRVSLENGWSIDTCSALPVPNIRSEAFRQWMAGLPQAKLPTARV